MVESKSFRITRRVQFSDIDWNSVKAILRRRHKMSAFCTDETADDFIRRIKRPVNLFWFLHPLLDEKHSKLGLSICDYLRADRVVVSNVRSLIVGFLRLSLEHELEIEPMARQDRAVCVSTVKISGPGGKVQITSFRGALILHLVLFLLGVASFVLFGFFIIYAIAILSLFLLNPAEVTRAALEDGPIGLALLSVFVVLAGVVGRILPKFISNLRIKSARSKTRVARMNPRLRCYF